MRGGDIYPRMPTTAVCHRSALETSSTSEIRGFCSRSVSFAVAPARVPKFVSAARGAGSASALKLLLLISIRNRLVAYSSSPLARRCQDTRPILYRIGVTVAVGVARAYDQVRRRSALRSQVGAEPKDGRPKREQHEPREHRARHLQQKARSHHRSHGDVPGAEGDGVGRRR